MKTLLAVTLISSLAFADPPVDAPLVCDGPPIPGVAVCVKAGEAAPFDGRLLSPAENTRRAKNAVDCKATLADAEQNVLLPKPAVAALISVAAAAVISSITLGIALAARKPP